MNYHYYYKFNTMKCLPRHRQGSNNLYYRVPWFHCCVR